LGIRPRYAQQGSIGGVPTTVEAPADGDGAESARTLRADALDLVNDDGRADSGRLGEKISEILQAAEMLASDLHADAEQALLVARSDAEQEVADRRREAEASAAAVREQAKRVLTASQEQAARILAEAEDHAASLRTDADERAKIRNERLQRVAEQHAERVLRFERDAIGRLREAQDDLQQAVERLTGSEHSPVLDLSHDQPAVRVGSIDVEAGPAAPPAPAERIRVTERSTERLGSDEGNADPVNRLVRAAVERAVENSADPESADPSVPGGVSAGASAASVAVSAPTPDAPVSH
jgi:hypothetical protein